MVDKQLAIITPVAGFGAFKPLEPEADVDKKWSDPFKWPHLSVAVDLGSDGVCACVALS